MLQRKSIELLFSALIVLFALYCYNPFELWFQNDDFVHIPLSAEGVLLQNNTFRPVCDISTMMDYWFWGKQAFGYHFTNLILHITACVLMFFLLKLLLKKYYGAVHTNSICWLASLLFFVYAMHSEAVFWILGRSAILGAIFSLAFLYCYLRRQDALKYLTGYIFFYIISLLTYESSWMLPVYCIVLTIAAVHHEKIDRKKEWGNLLILAAIFLLYLYIRWWYIHEIAGPYEAAAFFEGDLALLFRNFILLIARCFIPPSNTSIILLAGFVILAVCMALLLLRNNKQHTKQFIAMITCFLFSLLPYCSLGVDTNGTEGERFLYFPSLLVCMTGGVIIHFSVVNNLWKGIYIIALLAIHSLALYRSARNYRFAGSVNKSVMEALEKVSNKKTLYTEGLPQAQRGALMLRDGLTGMTKWLLPNTGFDTVIICSRRSELLPLDQPCPVIYSGELMPECRDSGDTISMEDIVVLRFTDSVLYIRK